MWNDLKAPSPAAAAGEGGGEGGGIWMDGWKIQSPLLKDPRRSPQKRKKKKKEENWDYNQNKMIIIKNKMIIIMTTNFNSDCNHFGVKSMMSYTFSYFGLIWL